MKLQELLSQFETALARGESVTAEHICRDHPELLDQFRQHARAIQGIAPPSEHVLASTSSSTSAEEGASRYTVLKAHARGGLGEVYLARDESLGRDVALKVMLGPGADERRRRFEREAAITGRLQHPGIVPIYGTGVDDRGRPCHVMRFVSGPTLAEAIEEFHKAKPALTRSTLRPLLTRLVQVAQTVAFANSRGVVHRDLKPSNIILGDYGETLVVDWGLAKELRIADRGLRIEDPIEVTDATNDGAVVGTPVYLSPEQARGEEVTPASDVFALGGLLYALLCGAAPYSGSNPVELMERSLEAAVPTFVSRGVAAPSALQAVALKAMAKNPADRFPDALAFAAEIDRWLADEPLECAPSPVSERLRRWTRRHRLLVTSSLAALVVAAVGLAVAAGLLSKKNTDLQNAILLAGTNEQAAVSNLRSAGDAVSAFTVQLNEDPRFRSSDVEAVRGDMLKAAKKFYAQLLERGGGEPAMLRQYADVRGKLGGLLLETGVRAEAATEFRAALELLDRLPGSPDDLKARTEYGLGLGAVLRLEGDAVGSLEVVRAAHAAGTARFSPPKSRSDRIELSAIETQLAAAIALVQGDSPEANAAFDRALQLARTNQAEDPKEPFAWRSLPEALKEQGVMKHRAGNLAAAEACWIAARDFQKNLPTQVIDRGNYLKHTYAGVCNHLGMLYLRQERWADAETAFAEAYRVGEILRRRHPYNYFYSLDYVLCQEQLGRLKLRQGDLKAAESLLQIAALGRQSLQAKNPKGQAEIEALASVRACHADALARLKKIQPLESAAPQALKLKLSRTEERVRRRDQTRISFTTLPCTSVSR